MTGTITALLEIHADLEIVRRMTERRLDRAGCSPLWREHHERVVTRMNALREAILHLDPARAPSAVELTPSATPSPST